MFVPLAYGGTSTSQPNLTYNGRSYQDWSYDFQDNGSIELPGRLYTPVNYDPTKSYPLVVFFHGSGQQGTNNTSQVNGPVANLLSRAAQENFFVYMPQASSGWGNAVLENTALQIANAQRRYSIDSERLYLTGFSLGGFGVWGVGGMNAGAVAALAPIAPSMGRLADINAKELVGKPIWIFRNFDDPQVGSSHPRNRARQILREGGLANFSYPSTAASYPIYREQNNLRYSENATGGHASNPTYGRDDLYEWMLAQKNTAGYLAAGETLRFDFGSQQVAAVTSIETSSSTPSDSYTGRRPDSSGKIWNSTASGFSSNKDAAFAFARTTEGRSTFVSLFVKDAFTDYNRTASPQTLFDANIGRDGWRTPSNQSSTIVLDGLTPGGLYDVEIFASTEQTTADVRFSQYQIGDELRTLEISANRENAALFKQVAANELGELTLVVTGTNGSTYGHIGTLTITAIPEPSAALAVMTGASLLCLTRRRKPRGTTKAPAK